MRSGSKESDETPTGPCTQCGKPGIVSVNRQNLCVDCWYKVEVTKTLAFRLQAISMNFAAQQMDDITGLGGMAPTPRIQVPDIPKGPFILNNIKLDNSIVGAINTGNVQTIDVSLTVLEQAGNAKAKEALKAMTEAILADASIGPAKKNELIEQIAFLAQQSVVAAKDRKPGLIKATLTSLTLAAQTITTLAAAWQAAEPILRNIFGP